MSSRQREHFSHNLPVEANGLMIYGTSFRFSSFKTCLAVPAKRSQTAPLVGVCGAGSKASPNTDSSIYPLPEKSVPFVAFLNGRSSMLCFLAMGLSTLVRCFWTKAADEENEMR